MDWTAGVSVTGIMLLVYALLAFEGHSPGGVPGAFLSASAGVFLIQYTIRVLWREGSVLPLLLLLGVLSYLGYAAAHAFFNW